MGGFAHDWRTCLAILNKPRYYGAFHIAREFLETTLGFAGKFTGHRSHGNVSNALIASGQGDAAEAGRRLQRLIRRRHSADYVLSDGVIVWSIEEIVGLLDFAETRSN